MSQRYNENTKRLKPQNTQLEIRDLKNLYTLPEISAEGFGIRRMHCWGYVCL